MGATFQALLETAEPASIGAEKRAGCKSATELEQSLSALFRATKLSSEKQELIRALVFLWHDHFDEAHNISQDISSADGSYLHGLVHRREPDYSNAKYWFHRVGKHRAFAVLTEQTGQPWDSFMFIDRCQRAGAGDMAELQRLQKMEFTVLLELFSHE